MLVSLYKKTGWLQCLDIIKNTYGKFWGVRYMLQSIKYMSVMSKK